MNLNKIDYLLLIGIGVLLIIDHFVSGFSHNFLAWIFAGLIVYSLNYKKYKEGSLEQIRNWQVVSTLIITGMVIIFSLIGTVNEPGVSFASGIFWFAILLSIFEIMYQTNQIKQGTDDR
ncbi:hypothetical protein [Piscibacillus salipiscarius]|uniref:Uncharacterized protein n=1 Tax=Piscibacillus salipiscarius TaxID=299480 RepID=A0ABW5QB01_9BACI|nr:hypothetical protein [Piscibacillus salipiscarius]